MAKTELLITNAIYFHGLFKISFDTQQSRENVAFYADRAQSAQRGTVTMMHSFEKRWVAQVCLCAILGLLKQGQSQSLFNFCH